MENTKAKRHVHPVVLARAKELRRPLTAQENKLWPRLPKRVFVSKRWRQTRIITRPANKTTPLLNAALSARSVTLQQLLGHQRVETTLRYARLYDSTAVRDYRRAMAGIEALKHRKSLNPLGPTTLNSLPHTGARILHMTAL